MKKHKNFQTAYILFIYKGNMGAGVGVHVDEIEVRKEKATDDSFYTNKYVSVGGECTPSQLYTTKPLITEVTLYPKFIVSLV